MSREPISSELRAFITDHIRSVAELECLLLLHKDPMREWGASELSRELRIDELWVMSELTNLAHRGFLSASETSPPQFRYAPKLPSVNESVCHLAIRYAERPISVIELIYSKPAGPLQSFADAFRFRKERPDG